MLSVQKLKSNSSIDVVYYDIPYWYSYSEHKPHFRNPDLGSVINAVRRSITHDIVVFGPPQLDFHQISDLCGDCEFERVFINGVHDRNNVYFGELISKPGLTEIRI